MGVFVWMCLYGMGVFVWNECVCMVWVCLYGCVCMDVFVWVCLYGMGVFVWNECVCMVWVCLYGCVCMGVLGGGVHVHFCHIRDLVNGFLYRLCKRSKFMIALMDYQSPGMHVK